MFYTIAYHTDRLGRPYPRPDALAYPPHTMQGSTSSNPSPKITRLRDKGGQTHAVGLDAQVTTPIPGCAEEEYGASSGCPSDPLHERGPVLTLDGAGKFGSLQVRELNAPGCYVNSRNHSTSRHA